MLLKCLMSTGTFGVKQSYFSHFADVERVMQMSQCWEGGQHGGNKVTACSGHSAPSCWWEGWKSRELPSIHIVMGFPNVGGVFPALGFYWCGLRGMSLRLLKVLFHF